MSSRDSPAGDFSDWLAGLQRALRGEGTSEVPCGTCTACCTSSQFVHIAPDETDTLAVIPPELLFAAPGLPDGHVLLGYDDNGRCPMLVDNACSIYPHRPRTCRTYDCRVFPATGVNATDEVPLVAERASRWRFSHPTPTDRAQHDAVRAAATFVEHNRERVPRDLVPRTATQLAIVAIKTSTAPAGHRWP